MDQKPIENSPGTLQEPDRRKFMQRMLNMSLGLWVVTGLTGVGYVAGKYIWPHQEMAVTGAEASMN